MKTITEYGPLVFSRASDLLDRHEARKARLCKALAFVLCVAIGALGIAYTLRFLS